MRGKPAPTRGKPSPTRGKPAPTRGKPSPTRGKLSPARGDVPFTRGDHSPIAFKLQTLVASWRQSLQRLEDQEDRAILLQWLEKRAAGGVEMILLEELEQDLAADGLL
jgi:hypothetical protein